MLLLLQQLLSPLKLQLLLLLRLKLQPFIVVTIVVCFFIVVVFVVIVVVVVGSRGIVVALLCRTVLYKGKRLNILCVIVILFLISAKGCSMVMGCLITNLYFNGWLKTAIG